MEFLGVGPLELLVILVVIMIVVGPQRLPEMAAQLGKFMRAFRHYTSQITADFNDALHDLEKEYDGMKGDWKQVGQGLDSTVRGVSEEVRTAAKDAGLTPNESKPVESAPIQSAPPSP